MIRNGLVFVILAISFIFSSVQVADAAAVMDWPDRNNPNPNRPDGVGVFMANGVFDANDTSYAPPTFDDFETVIMGRDDAEKAERKAEAVAFFLEQYGIDFTNADAAQEGSILLVTNYADPRWNYRCYHLPGRWVPKSGLIIHDANYAMAVVGPQATLYGRYGGADGIVVPFGTVAVDGEYLVQGTNRFRQGHRKNVHMRFQTLIPIENALSGNIKFNCKLSGFCLGDGAGIGRQEFFPLSNGMTQVSIQNVLQFPAPQWIQELEE